jgi:hypothetical protein
VPAGKLEELMSGLGHFDEMKMGYTNFTMDIRPDFPRPEFYKELFKTWGLDVED